MRESATLYLKAQKGERQSTSREALERTGVELLASVFRENSVLRHVSVSSNNFTRAHVELFERALRSNSTLVGLHCEGQQSYVDSRGYPRWDGAGGDTRQKTPDCEKREKEPAATQSAAAVSQLTTVEDPQPSQLTPVRPERRERQLSAKHELKLKQKALQHRHVGQDDAHNGLFARTTSEYEALSLESLSLSLSLSPAPRSRRPPGRVL